MHLRIYTKYNRTSDTEIIDEKSIIIPTVIQHFSFAEDVHNFSTRSYAPFIPQPLNSSRNIINIS